ncbi:VCBS repeat-containing protein [Streptomyces sp. P9(2023)]|uniref:FG-GAP repeat domain-containing protein n=1 Tax=Streptomyces sp. P9(2023) TaxID=3064394 RepID=UPI0028F458DE|nr:VCBS repeat-containing protein [Streptomyces sp. P9(2023)]MDT9690512.1 VCBS repeat-containing protein [Streptomyces sp. P9(2023)]
MVQPGGAYPCAHHPACSGARTRIGGGWNAYSQLVGAGDVDHDGKADLFAHHPGSKRVYLYSGTGEWRTPFRAREVTGVHADESPDHTA